MRVKPTFRILCVNWLVRASRAKTKLPRLDIQFRQHSVLIVPQTIERGLILVLSWVVLMCIDICFRVVLTRINIHAHVVAHTAIIHSRDVIWLGKLWHEYMKKKKDAEDEVIIDTDEEYDEEVPAMPRSRLATSHSYLS
eukprot:scaffold1005_cov202-Amphora_coffeaeformis.AAC.2